MKYLYILIDREPPMRAKQYLTSQMQQLYTDKARAS